MSACWKVIRSFPSDEPLGSDARRPRSFPIAHKPGGTKEKRSRFLRWNLRRLVGATVKAKSRHMVCEAMGRLPARHSLLNDAGCRTRHKVSASFPAREAGERSMHFERRRVESAVKKVL